MNINSSLQKTPIAVIGMSAMFADAKNLEEFWTNIIEAKDSIKEVPADRWLIEDYYDPDMFAEDKTYCKVGGFLPKIDFNPMEFGLPPNILEVTDASQLLALVAARDAFEDAGYGRKSEKFTAALKAKTGVIIGVGGGQKLITPLTGRLQYPVWEKALRSSGIAENDIPPIIDKMKKAYIGWNENSFPGMLGNVISGRITNRFDLGGINSVVDAACAASLSAMKMALSELVEGRCDMMLTGGVDTDNSPFMYMSFSKTPAFSKSGKITPFADDADGMLIGEGLGMLVLKRLEDAERDGDNIYSVIKGIGTSSDGRFKSVYAPRPSGQAMAMQRTYEDAGYGADTVGLIEAHGTGTGAGDAAELTSMNMVFGKDNPKKQHIALGSVKSQVGHTKAAAGAAGMVKAALALHHKVLPPTINVDKPSSKVNIADTAMYVNTEARPWLRNGHPRRASVSAFGFGGINVHIAMEEYQGKKQSNYRLHEPFKTILLQDTSPAKLMELLKITSEILLEEGDNAFNDLAKKSRSTVFEKNNARISFVAKNTTEAIDFLQTAIQTLGSNQNEWTHPKGIYYRPNGMDTNGKVVALFAGQGSQYIGMGKELANVFPEVREAFAKTDGIFYKENLPALSKTIFPIPVFSDAERKVQQTTLTQTQNAQPAIGTLSMGQYKVLQRAGFQPSFTSGHSFGELTALWAAGVYDDDTFIALAKTRGAAMATSNPDADTGTMLAVKASAEQVQPAIEKIQGVKIANINSNNQVVLGGSTAAIQITMEHLKEQGFRVVPLPVSAAFHTEFVKHAQQPFASFIQTQKFNRPQIPVFANSTGQQYPDNLNELKAILKGQILNPVYFKNQIENIHAAGGRIFVEFGPKGVLTNLVKNILKEKDHTAIAINANAKKDSDLQFRQAVAQLQVLGVSLNNVDPYKKDTPILPPKTKLNVDLGGNNYVSPKTQKAYTDVMNNGFQVSGGQTKIIEKVVEKIVEVEKVVGVPAANHFINQTESEEEIMNKQALEIIKSALETFNSNQAKSLAIFEKFMSDQNQQSQQLLNLLQQQMNATSQTPVAKTVAQPVVTNVAPVVRETPVYSNGNGNASANINSNGNGNGVGATLVVAQPNEKPTSPEKVTTKVTPTNSGTDTSKLEAALLEVVSEKTGYPTEMLELNMDMEADLGIDSIKRVEIFGALTAQYPEMSGINPNELTELRTLGEIVDYVSAKGGAAVANLPTEQAGNASTTSTPTAITTVHTPAPAPTVTSTSTGTDTAKLEAALLEVVSEKTGYPAEMLELGMDMEADLGIDSIKRVEIFGALTAQYPEMSGINPNELTELRTLGEIVDYVSQKGGAPVGATLVVAHPQPTPTTPEKTTTTPSSNNADLEKALLEVVSEKTGYPAEMLELGMDMEADLGIDSIKRVEIFGALTSQYPSMADINPNELTELRTLGEIVDYVSSKKA